MNHFFMPIQHWLNMAYSCALTVFLEAILGFMVAFPAFVMDKGTFFPLGRSNEVDSRVYH
jgi:hypothetical protein